MIELRDYQKEALNKLLWDRQFPDNSLVVLPQGCLSSSTPIPLWNGGIKMVKDLKSGDEIISYDSFLNETKKGIVDSLIKSCLNPKPMIEFFYEGETITTTYDHPFFNGKRFYPLYQLVWGEMEKSQRVQLKLLCKQYGQTFNYKIQRGLQSCCNSTCSRCKRIFEDSNEWKNDKGSQNSGRKLVKEPLGSSSSKPYKWNKGRQQGFKSGVVFGKIQCLYWTQDRENKNSNKRELQEVGKKNPGRDKEILSKKNIWTKEQYGEKETLRYSPREIPQSDTSHYYQNSNRKFYIKIKQAEPYYSICMQKAPYTYCIGKRNFFITHNSGKSVVIASYIEAIKQNVLILQPGREILKQNKDKLLSFVSEEEVGAFSASLDLKEIKKYTFATIQSIYKKPELFTGFKTVIVDEADLINPRKENMYKDFLKAIGNPKVVGFTGTPYRLAQRYRRWGPNAWQVATYSVTELINRVWPPFWKRILFNITTQELIGKGYLSPVVYINETLLEHKKIKTNKTKTDFDLVNYWHEVKEARVEDKINKLASNYNSVLVFCSTIEEAETLSSLCFKGKVTAVVTHKTDKKTRKKIIEDFKDGKIYAVFNVQTLTVGFDHPALDCIILNRPTRSIRLYNQMLGRGTRIHPSKKFCTVIDFSGTVEELGTLESFRIEKIDGKWEIVSDKGVWHNKELYSFKLPVDKR